MLLRSLPFVFLSLGLTGQPALAQSGADLALAAARNQLGILEFCHAQGHIDDRAIARQAAMFSRLPAASDPRPVEAAYATGQRGILSAMGVAQPIAEAATQQGLDEAGLCRQIAALALRGS